MPISGKQTLKKSYAEVGYRKCELALILVRLCAHTAANGRIAVVENVVHEFRESNGYHVFYSGLWNGRVS
jgi:hypothetical protein